MEHVVIIGAGQAGAGAALKLRELGFDGRITLIGAEDHPPYERPELSKGYVSGKVAFEKLVILTPEMARAQGIDMRLSTRVTGIDREENQVWMGDDRLPYDHLIFATGGMARRLELPETLAAKAHVIRDRADADGLRAALPYAERIAVIGGGWLGLEAAATCRAQGADVHIFEAGSRLCARVAPTWLSERLAALHTAHDVTLHMGGMPEFCSDGAVEVPGCSVACDLLLIATGLQAADDLARSAGLPCSDGIEVDARGRTADPCVYAVGDCARYAHLGGVRRESWQNANQSAEDAARAILGLKPRPQDADWFWSNQFDANIQMLGDCRDVHDQSTRGAGDGGAETLFFLEAGRLAGCIGIDAARDVGMSRRLIAQGARMDMARLGDPAIPLRDCVLMRA